MEFPVEETVLPNSFFQVCSDAPSGQPHIQSKVKTNFFMERKFEEKEILLKCCSQNEFEVGGIDV